MASIVLIFIGAGRGGQVRHLPLHPQTLGNKLRIEKRKYTINLRYVEVES
jgi:hypothetical protein